MKILLDECFPRELASEFAGLHVTTVEDMDWKELKNGDLLRKAEALFDVFVSIDQGIPFQQNYVALSLAFIIVRVTDNRIETIKAIIPSILDALPKAEQGKIIWVPRPPRTWHGQ